MASGEEDTASIIPIRASETAISSVVYQIQLQHLISPEASLCSAPIQVLGLRSSFHTNPSLRHQPEQLQATNKTVLFRALGAPEGQIRGRCRSLRRFSVPPSKVGVLRLVFLRESTRSFLWGFKTYYGTATHYSWTYFR